MKWLPLRTVALCIALLNLVACGSEAPSSLGTANTMVPAVVWSRGYSALVRLDNPQIPASYFALPTETLFDAEAMEQAFVGLHGWVWLRSGSHKGGPNDVATFVQHGLGSLTRPIRLITSDGDSSIPSDLAPGVAEAILDHPLVTAWHTQNLDGSLRHSKLRPVPIGLNLHSGDDPEENLERLLRVAAVAKPPEERPNRVLMDVRTISHPERAQMASVLRGREHIVEVRERQPFEAAMTTFADSRFALSPRGNGLDCHRTWELLALGTIPIVRSGPLDALYEGLPVVIVDAWEEVLDAQNLDRWFAELAPLLQTSRAERVALSRWLP